jgi:hypothetical protein
VGCPHRESGTRLINHNPTGCRFKSALYIDISNHEALGFFFFSLIYACVISVLCFQFGPIFTFSSGDHGVLGRPRLQSNSLQWILGMIRNIVRNSWSIAKIHLQDSSAARFTPCALIYLVAVPLGIISIVFLCKVFGDRFRPNWSQPFVPVNPVLPVSSQKNPPSYSVILLALSVVGCVAHIIDLVTQARGTRWIESLLLLLSWVSRKFLSLFFGLL